MNSITQVFNWQSMGQFASSLNQVVRINPLTSIAIGGAIVSAACAAGRAYTQMKQEKLAATLSANGLLKSVKSILDSYLDWDDLISRLQTFSESNEDFRTLLQNPPSSYQQTCQGLQNLLNIKQTLAKEINDKKQEVIAVIKQLEEILNQAQRSQEIALIQVTKAQISPAEFLKYVRESLEKREMGKNLYQNWSAIRDGGSRSINYLWQHFLRPNLDLFDPAQQKQLNELLPPSKTIAVLLKYNVEYRDTMIALDDSVYEIHPMVRVDKQIKQCQTKMTLELSHLSNPTKPAIIALGLVALAFALQVSGLYRKIAWLR